MGGRTRAGRTRRRRRRRLAVAPGRALTAAGRSAAGEAADGGGVHAVVAAATDLAARWGATAGRATTTGQERATLRLFGVGGLDRAGRPLDAAVIERYIGTDPDRLAAGIALPFAIAMAEYDLAPLDLALEVAAGNVDLAVEAELLAEPARRAAAIERASVLGRAAADRVDANRTARRELLAVLGDPARPWLGTSLVEPAIVDALDEARAAIASGVAVLRVEVPAGRELTERLRSAGAPIDPWRPGAGSRSGLDAFDPSGTPVPSGSQRALRVLRRRIDEAAAEFGGYVRLATDAPALAAPEQAVVAAFERVDLVVADPVRDILAGRVDPGRALADHAFAQRLLARGGVATVVPSGTLVVGPDLAAGIPSDVATRVGRALALQLLAVALARANGIPEAGIIVDALPDWLVGEPDAPAWAATGVALRRAALPGHPLAFVEPPLEGEPVARWHAIVAALLAEAGDAALILRQPRPGFAAGAGHTRAAAWVARSLAAARGVPLPTAPSLAGAAAVVAAAGDTLRALAAEGWPSLAGGALGDALRLGADAVTERTGDFDALAVLAPDPITAG